MLKYIKEFKKHVLITGFRNVEIKNLDDFLATTNNERTIDADVQFFNAQLVATWQHLYFATLNALTAFKNEGHISKKLTVEIMLYASAQHQIRKATETLGVKPNTSNIAMVVVGENAEAVKSMLPKISRQISAQPDDEVLELTDKKVAEIRRIFGITEKEMEPLARERGTKDALVNLVIEHMALLSTGR